MVSIYSLAFSPEITRQNQDVYSELEVSNCKGKAANFA